jgi:hypothetical protein
VLHLATKGILAVIQARAPITPGACEVSVTVSGNPDVLVVAEEPVEVLVEVPPPEVAVAVEDPPEVIVIVEDPEIDVETEC